MDDAEGEKPLTKILAVLAQQVFRNELIIGSTNKNRSPCPSCRRVASLNWHHFRTQWYCHVCYGQLFKPCCKCHQDSPTRHYNDGLFTCHQCFEKEGRIVHTSPAGDTSCPGCGKSVVHWRLDDGTYMCQACWQNLLKPYPESALGDHCAKCDSVWSTRWTKSSQSLLGERTNDMF